MKVKGKDLDLMRISYTGEIEPARKWGEKEVSEKDSKQRKKKG